MVLVVLGGMHFFNLYVFSRIRQRGTSDDTGTYSEPGAYIDAQE
jgi:hypothetical protein